MYSDYLDVELMVAEHLQDNGVLQCFFHGKLNWNIVIFSGIIIIRDCILFYLWTPHAYMPPITLINREL